MSVLKADSGGHLRIPSALLEGSHDPRMTCSMLGRRVRRCGRIGGKSKISAVFLASPTAGHQRIVASDCGTGSWHQRVSMRLGWALPSQPDGVTATRHWPACPAALCSTQSFGARQPPLRWPPRHQQRQNVAGSPTSPGGRDTRRSDN